MSDGPAIPRTVSHTDFRNLQTEVRTYIDEDRKEHKEMRDDMRKRSESHASQLVELKLLTTRQNVTLDTIVRQTRREEAHVDKAIERGEDTRAHLIIKNRELRNKLIAAVGLALVSGGGWVAHWLVSR